MGDLRGTDLEHKAPCHGLVEGALHGVAPEAVRQRHDVTDAVQGGSLLLRLDLADGLQHPLGVRHRQATLGGPCRMAPPLAMVVVLLPHGCWSARDPLRPARGDNMASQFRRCAPLSRGAPQPP